MRIRINGIDLFVDVHGPALARRDGATVERPVLLALHGSPGLDHANLVPWLEVLADDLEALPPAGLARLIAHSDTLVRGIPGARQVMFEESGHQVRVIKEENERFVRVVTEFIHEAT
jgi:hypothetical protein